MYLSKRIYVKNWDHFTPEERWEIGISRGGKKVPTKLRPSYLFFEVAYWRKANAIHKWFVDNCQKGRDECQESYVEEEQLVELLALCKDVALKVQMAEGMITNGYTITAEGEIPILEPGKLITNAEEIAELLPTEGGFFFGSTDYDEGYLMDVEQTITQLENAFKDSLDGDFYYQASW